jgi:hypothetical protein
MEYDPTEMYRVDPGETELTDEFQAEMALERQAKQEQAAQADPTLPGETTPTGGQPTTTQQPTQPTGSEKEQQFPWEEGYDLGDYARQTAEGAFAAPAGMLDFGVDVINKVSGQNFQKLPEFQTDHFQALRQISSVVLPTLGLTRLGMGGGAAAHGRIGWSLGNNAFVKAVSTLGVETAAGVTVGAVSSEYTEDNLTGSLKQAWPKTWDFIPDWLATLKDESPDLKRKKNMYEDVGMGTVTSLAQGMVKLGKAMANAASSLRKSNRLVGETPQARAWLEGNTPKALPDDPEEAVLQSVVKQEDALDEIGYYNMSENPNMDVPLKGVHDMFDYSELGVRTVDDFGVVGASIDQARIARNLDTVDGRIGNMISEPALKYALRSGENAQDIVLGLADQLHQAGRIGMEGANWKVTFDDVIDANENLAIQLFDPRMSKTEVRQILEPYMTRDASGKEVLAEEGFAMAAKALRGFGSELTSMDVARAQSLLAGSLSGRIADLAEGSRLMEGTAGVEAAQEKVIDLMQYLSQLSGSAKYYKNRKANLIQFIKNGFKNIEGYNAASVEQAGEVAQKVFQDSQRFANTLRQIAYNQPRLMEEFLMAYEVTDGSIDTIVKMNNWISGQTLDLGKAFINLNPEVEHKLVAGVWSTIYNGMLSAFVTPIQALVGNFGGIISQPVSHFAGAMLDTDFKAVQRGWVAYTSLGETLKRALPYAGSLFMKASREPDAVRGATRLDLLLQSEKQMEFLQTSARRQAAEGNEGLQYIVNQIEMLNDLAKDPVLRFGPNAMTALDGFTGVFNASAEARFRAMDELIAAGNPITKENVKPIADKYYKQMFDETGMIKDEAVKYATNEMALNLDTPLASGLSGLIQRLPGLRPFMFFPTVGMNVIDMGGKYNPLWTPFQRDVNELAHVKLQDLLGDEARIDEMLSARGIDVDSLDSIAKQNKIADLKYTTRGRKAIAGLTVASTVGLVMNDRITGDGLYDKEAQRNRVKQTNWKKRSVKGLDGRYYSYEWLGPLADWIAFTVNVVDNFDMLGEAMTEKFLEKSTFVLGAALTDRTALSTLRPLVEMAAGNGFEANRWSAGFVNSLAPLSGQRREWSRIFSEGMREVDNDFISYLENANSFMGELDPSNRNPYVYSPVSGKKANGYGFLQRLYNAYSPLKIHDGQTDEERFLQEIEYDVSTSFKTKDGVKLTRDERSELFRIMGEDQIFATSIREIMQDAGDWESIAKLRKLRRLPNLTTSDEVPLKQWHDIHVRLGEAQRAAEAFAFSRMDADMFAAIELRQEEKILREKAAVLGESLDPTLSIRN